MPVYNAEKFLRVTLDSIQAQTYKNWELIAIDDSSKDNSLNILKSYAATDKRIKVYKNQRNRGVGHTLNRTVSLAKGKFLARMDSDDVMLPNRLSQQLAYLQKHIDTVVVGGQCKLIDVDGQQIGLKTYPTDDQSIRRMSFVFSPVSHPSIMINRSLVPDDFSWYSPTACPAEDIDLYFKLFQFGKFANLKQTVIKYRLYPDSTSFRNPKYNFRKTYEVRQRAQKMWGYNPSLKSKIANEFQKVLVEILPPLSVYHLYRFVRGLVEIHLNITLSMTRFSERWLLQ